MKDAGPADRGDPPERAGGPPPLRPEWRGRGEPIGSGSARMGAADDAPLPLGDRVVDWMNPVLVRELRQSLRSRGYLVALGVVLLVIGIVAAVLANLASTNSLSEGEGFIRSLQAMIAATVLVVPMRVLGSIGREVDGTLSEHVLLTRLSPARIVDGHILAACVQLLVIGSLFAPLLALSYLLRGVDVATVALGLGFALTSALGLTAAAAAAGSLGRQPAVRAIGKVLGAIGTVVALMSLLGAIETTFRFGRIGRIEWLELLGWWVVPIGFGVALCRLIAKAMLSHPFENRSTGFRIHAVVTSLALFGVLVALERGTIAREASYLAAVAIGLALPVWLVAATEEDGLSPLVKARLGGRSPLVLLLTPFYPGGSSGVLFALLHAGLILGLAGYLPRLLTGAPADPEALGIAALVACYGLVYAGLGRLIRRAFGGGGAKSWVARAVLFGVFVAGMLLPALLDLVTDHIGDWHIGHLLNPFFTIDEHDRDPWSMVMGLGALGVALCLVHLPKLAGAVREVGAAAAARRPEGAERPRRA